MPTSAHDIIQFLSNHFEEFLYLNVVVFAMAVVVVTAVKIKYFDYKRVKVEPILNTFLCLVAVGQFCLAFNIYWVNYKKVPPLLENYPLLTSDTRWVKSDLIVYFINENKLMAVKAQGGEETAIFQAPDAIREYYFSPGGQHMLVSTGSQLFLLNRINKKFLVIDQISNPGEGDNKEDSLQGSIGGIRWSADSLKFCYEISRWSKFSSQDQLCIYDVKTQTKKFVKSPSRRISSVYWDKGGENLYYLRSEALDTSFHAHAFEIGVFKISLETLDPQKVGSISAEQAKAPIENLRSRNIELFTEAVDKLSFGRDLVKDIAGIPPVKESQIEQEGHFGFQNNIILKKAGDAVAFIWPFKSKKISQPAISDTWVSSEGSFVGIDQMDNFFFVNKKWFRKRLFKVARETIPAENFRYEYKESALSDIHWIPQGRYVIFKYSKLGVLILDPLTSQVGVLTSTPGIAFGWYDSGSL